MTHAQARALDRLDIVVLVVTVGVAAIAVAATDLEYRGLSSAPFDVPWSRWPSWARRLIRPTGRVQVAVMAFTLTLAVGAAICAYRPGRDRPARRGPGDVALALAFLLASIMALGVALDRGISPLIPLPPGSARGYGPLFYSYWVPLTWRTAEAVAAAWIALALTGGWRRPAGPTERLGRCLA